MKVMVVVRMVPDPSGEMEIASNGSEIDREWIDLKLNDFDDHALEQAVLLKEQTGGLEVVAVAAAGDGVDRMLQTALARGADKAVRLDHELGDAPSSRSLARALATFAREDNVELVLTGVQSPEDVFGQLAPYVGGLLGWPHVSSVSGTSLRDGQVEVLQEQGNGITARLAVALPAVLGIQAATQPPRYISGARLRQAQGERIGERQADDVALANAATIVRLQAPVRSGGAQQLGEDSDAVADRLLTILGERGFMKERA